MNHPIDNVASFMILGGQYFPNDTDRDISKSDIRKFIERIDEEVEETYFASARNEIQIAEALDGAIDTAYVAMTLAIRLVGPLKARKAWDAVVDANLAKVDGRYGDPIINPDTGKIGKPEGWTAPDIEAIVNA
jgi:predicted HAD superfamily Cof-like phosphohydrolase